MTFNTSFPNCGFGFFAYILMIFVMNIFSPAGFAKTASGEVFHVESKSMSAVERGEEISFLKSTEQDLQSQKLKAHKEAWTKQDEFLLNKVKARLQLLERDQNLQALSHK